MADPHNNQSKQKRYRQNNLLGDVAHCMITQQADLKEEWIANPSLEKVNGTAIIIPGMTRTSADKDVISIKNFITSYKEDYWNLPHMIAVKHGQFRRNTNIKNKFNGDPDKLTDFITDFANNIYINTKLDNNTKLKALNDNLRGRAKKIWTLQKPNPSLITDKILEDVLDAFIQQFFTPYTATECLFRHISNIQIIKKNKIENLTDLIIKIEKFKNMADKYDDIYTGYERIQRTILAKFRNWLEIRNNLEKYFSKIKNSVKNSPAQVGQKTVHYALTFLQDYFNSYKQRTKQDDFWMELNPPEPQKSKTKHCIFCNEGHTKHQCLSFDTTSVKKKRGICFKSNLCFKCLKDYTKEHKCARFCAYCKQTHNTVLCTKREKENQVTICNIAKERYIIELKKLIKLQTVFF